MSKSTVAPATQAATVARLPVPITDRERIQALGRKITIGGRVRRVRMGLGAIAYLEDRYDGLDGYLRALSQRGWGAGKVRACIAGMIAGLLHEKPEGQEIEDFEKEVEEALDGSVEGLMGWILLVAAALDDGWPEVKANDPKGPGRSRRSTSPGRSSITQPRSRSGGPTSSSGG